jgi:hypothetical protein
MSKYWMVLEKADYGEGRQVRYSMPGLGSVSVEPITVDMELLLKTAIEAGKQQKTDELRALLQI